MKFLRGIPMSCKPISDYKEDYEELLELGNGAFGVAL
jgi:hypothetical protein